MLLDDASSPFHVAPSSTLHVHAMHAATRELASRPHPATSTVRSPAPGSPWPWFLAFLATVAGLWALERRRPSSGRPD
ncbi:hypothetical protein [Alkalisalibacterium limincola]|uniref:Uncharacterized protein n=1 Tax=Alkalisalibacterium limincola TaxID=2699169 RepID=A0A5C8KQA9_9GAMM|nr:hypothetical protein [Alkalisalibacterium limincola]TXK62110.1 hypothetical protein FU658_09705 [Alkalisalibacterium limincola]